MFEWLLNGGRVPGVYGTWRLVGNGDSGGPSNNFIGSTGHGMGFIGDTLFLPVYNYCQRKSFTPGGLSGNVNFFTGSHQGMIMLSPREGVLVAFGGKDMGSDTYITSGGHWTSVTFGPRHGASYAAGVAIGDTFYVMGGYFGGVLDTFFSYNYTTRVKTQLPTGPSPRYKHAMAAIGSDIYLYGGTGAVGWLGDFWKYDTLTGEWELLGNPLPGSRYEHTLDAIGNRLYLFGSGVESKFWTYDTSNETWSIAHDGSQPISGSIRAHASCVHKGRLYIQGGTSKQHGIWEFTPP